MSFPFGQYEFQLRPSSPTLNKKPIYFVGYFFLQKWLFSVVSIYMDKNNNAEKSEYPMRINKYLAQKGICSRREADVLVARSLVKINGRNAKVGDKISEGDQVDVSKKVKNFKKLQYFVFNKPIGIVTVSPAEGEKSVADIADFPEGVFPNLM